MVPTIVLSLSDVSVNDTNNHVTKNYGPYIITSSVQQMDEHLILFCGVVWNFFFF